jgi:hypothetical protein
MKSNYSFALS